MWEFEELYKIHYSQVYKYVLKLCKDEIIAEEITQETFFKVLKNLAGFKGQCKFSVWVCQIAKNTYFTYLKKNRMFSEIPIDACPSETESGPENLIADKDMSLRIHKILHDMEEPYREVFWMRIFGELSFREIACIHKKSESWARVTYHRAKIRIKEKLNEISM